MSERPVPPSPDVLMQLAWRVLRPFARLLILGGLPFPRLSELLRQLYVDVATRDLLPDAKSRTDSRVSMLTGVHRKELRRLRGMARSELAVPQGVALGNAVIGRWLGAEPWADDEGRPRPLPRTAPAGEPSFDALVGSVTRDVRARTVLEEWLSQGLVTIRDDGLIALDAEAFLPKPRQAEQLFYVARNLHDHIAAAVANVTATGAAPFLERSVHYDGLSADAAARLDKFARAAAQRLLMQVNREALRLLDQDSPGDAPTHRVNVGIYLFGEPDAPAHDDQAPDAAPSHDVQAGTTDGATP